MNPVTTKYTFDEKMISNENNSTSLITILEGNMFNYASYRYKLGQRVCLHNYANNFKPGLYRVRKDGSHYFISNTQEEQLLKASLINGKIFLPLNLYPISDFKQNKLNCLYSKDVNFKMDENYISDVITCANLMYPKLLDGEYIDKNQEKTILNLMILILTTASDSDVFITGLWGCGAFGHPIKPILKLWKRAMLMSIKKPREIIFCYYKDMFTNILNEDENSFEIMKILL